MYKFIKLRHDILIQCHRNYMEMKKFNYMLEIYILRNSSEKIWVICGVLFKVWVSKKTPRSRVLARISKMPVQNSNFKFSARPDLATYLLQILIPATINCLVHQKGQYTLQLCLRRWFVKIIFGYYTQKVKIERFS